MMSEFALVANLSTGHEPGIFVGHTTVLCLLLHWQSFTSIQTVNKIIQG